MFGSLGAKEGREILFFFVGGFIVGDVCSWRFFLVGERGGKDRRASRTVLHAIMSRGPSVGIRVGKGRTVYEGYGGALGVCILTRDCFC